MTEIKFGKREIPVPLGDLPVGSLFVDRTTGCIAVLSEYGNCEAYIVGSGELFWGGTTTPEERRTLMVHPLDRI